MKFSVITVSFNSEKTIEETILSVIRQNYNNFEYILVDGGSNDKTLEIVNKYKKYFSKIISEKDEGVYDAINKGIKVSTGDIISIIHSDDLFISNEILSKINNIFKKNLTTKILVGNTLIFKLKKNKKKIIRNYRSAGFYNWMMYFGYSPPHPSSFIKKEVYSKFGLYNKKFKIAGDFEFFLKALIVKKINLNKVNENLVLMRMGGKSNSSISSHIISTKEILASFRINNLKNFLPMVMIRFPLKLFQYLFK